jgi:hypothetical protein
MYRQDSEKEKDLESFYLDIPEEKLFYPIDLEWGTNDSIQSSLKISDKLSVDLQKSEKKEIEIKEVNLKKYKNRTLK